MIHSVLPTGGIYVPWSAQLLGSKLPYHWAGGYAVFAAITLALSVGARGTGRPKT